MGLKDVKETDESYGALVGALQKSEASQWDLTHGKPKLFDENRVAALPGVLRGYESEEDRPRLVAVMRRTLVQNADSKFSLNSIISKPAVPDGHDPDSGSEGTEWTDPQYDNVMVYELRRIKQIPHALIPIDGKGELPVSHFNHDYDDDMYLYFSRVITDLELKHSDPETFKDDYVNEFSAAPLVDKDSYGFALAPGFVSKTSDTKSLKTTIPNNDNNKGLWAVPTLPFHNAEFTPLERNPGKRIESWKIIPQEEKKNFFIPGYIFHGEQGVLRDALLRASRANTDMRGRESSDESSVWYSASFFRGEAARKDIESDSDDPTTRRLKDGARIFLDFLE